jgi:hypothetical protein
VKSMVEFVKKLKAGNPEMVKFLHCDNSGENESV